MVPWLIAAAAAVMLVVCVWAFSENTRPNISKSPPTNQTSGLGTQGSVDQPLKTDLQR